jgi:hypothetical protein
VIVRLRPDASGGDREVVVAVLRSLGGRVTPGAASIETDTTLADDDAVRVASLPGVERVELSPAPPATLGEAALDFVAGAAAVLGVLVLVTAAVSAPLGPPADPMRTPPEVVPSWPLLAWYAAVDVAPAWAPVPLLFCVAAFALLVWPLLARCLATERPRLHTLLGVAALGLAAALAVRELVA